MVAFFIVKIWITWKKSKDGLSKTEVLLFLIHMYRQTRGSVRIMWSSGNQTSNFSSTPLKLKLKLPCSHLMVQVASLSSLIGYHHLYAFQAARWREREKEEGQSLTVQAQFQLVSLHHFMLYAIWPEFRYVVMLNCKADWNIVFILAMNPAIIWDLLPEKGREAISLCDGYF